MKAKDRIKVRGEQVLYRKVGKKFIPVNDPYAYNGLKNGWWLIKVTDGCTSIREAVYPDNAELEAAARDKEDELVEIIRKATQARPGQIFLSKEEKRDWDKFIKKYGDSFNNLYYPSFSDSAAQIIKTLKG